jgi:hypothetical protein
MPIIRLDLDAETFKRLAEIAVDERRPIPWQAEVLLQRAMGLPSPLPWHCASREPVEAQVVPHAQ